MQRGSHFDESGSLVSRADCTLITCDVVVGQVVGGGWGFGGRCMTTCNLFQLSGPEAKKESQSHNDSHLSRTFCNVESYCQRLVVNIT